MKRAYQFPNHFLSEIQRIFSQNKWGWNPRQLAEDVLQLSDFYIRNPSASTPWDKAWARRALLVYYWPLNATRFQAVYDELENLNFFDGLDHAFDFGAGPATAGSVLKNRFKKLDLIELSTVPQEWFPGYRWTPTPWISHSSWDRTCTVFCYSMTELPQIPNWALQSQALIITEPATQQDGRKLLQLRQSLLERNFFAWAPCSHQNPCPLLMESKTDWCHDRIELQAPDWFLEIENHLPIKNKTLTMSYLAMKRQPPPRPDWARITGDALHEKGKTRQMVCRDSKREFLAWMHRDGTPPDFYRGERVFLEEFDNKSNELRIKKIRRVEPLEK